ncbi:MAG TPA: agmatinase [Candidatus Hydrogenedentes bacterium]|nr:agmatinase [Candidatus Hydrogenedentota bacterium]HOL76893.1 agmatinase [Candidatus Hydrogenedentota bacterium]HPO85545.1 agmatinase [Candidatus Hydrogenedentota bacterium]
MLLSFLPTEQNFLGLPAEYSGEDARVVVVAVPYESTSTYGRGSYLGPQAIIAASHEVELYDAVLAKETYLAVKGIGTIAPFDFSDMDGEAVAARVYEITYSLLKRGKKVVLLGGEHTSVVGNVKAHCRYFQDVSVLQFDAHSDLRPDYLDNPWNHACAATRILDFHDHLVQVGIRSQSVEDSQVATQRRIPIFYAHEIFRKDTQKEDWAEEIISSLRPNVYITFDCDVLDPSVVPGTGTPEPGGLTWYQLDHFLAALCKKRRVVGVDVSELSPIPGQHHSEFTIAKLIYRMIGYAFSCHEEA